MRSWVFLILVAAFMAATAVNSTPITKRAPSSPDSESAETQSKSTDVGKNNVSSIGMIEALSHAEQAIRTRQKEKTIATYSEVHDDAQKFLWETIQFTNKNITSILYFIKKEEYEFDRWKQGLDKEKLDREQHPRHRWLIGS